MWKIHNYVEIKPTSLKKEPKKKLGNKLENTLRQMQMKIKHPNKYKIELKQCWKDFMAVKSYMKYQKLNFHYTKLERKNN